MTKRRKAREFWVAYWDKQPIGAFDNEEAAQLYKSKQKVCFNLWVTIIKTVEVLPAKKKSKTKGK